MLLKCDHVSKIGGENEKKIKRKSIISGAYLQYLCKYSAKFQIPAQKIVRLRGVDFTKLVGFMVLNTTFKQYFSYIMAVSFIGAGNRSTRRKSTDQSQVTDKLDHIL